VIVTPVLWQCKICVKILLLVSVCTQGEVDEKFFFGIEYAAGNQHGR
jgi:hypothetical protein